MLSRVESRVTRNSQLTTHNSQLQRMGKGVLVRLGVCVLLSAIVAACGARTSGSLELPQLPAAPPSRGTGWCRRVAVSVRVHRQGAGSCGRGPAASGRRLRRLNHPIPDWRRRFSRQGSFPRPRRSDGLPRSTTTSRLTTGHSITSTRRSSSTPAMRQPTIRSHGSGAMADC